MNKHERDCYDIDECIRLDCDECEMKTLNHETDCECPDCCPDTDPECPIFPI